MFRHISLYEIDVRFLDQTKKTSKKCTAPRTVPGCYSASSLFLKIGKILIFWLSYNLMARTAEQRKNKLRKTLESRDYGKLFESQKKQMIRGEAQASKDFEIIELTVKKLMGVVPLVHIPYYIIFAKEIYKLKKKHSAETLLKEVEIKQMKWISRGLDWQKLDDIKELYTSYIGGDFFRLDISLLDGNDRLA